MSILSEDQVRSGFERIISEYGLHVFAISDDEIGLSHPRYVITVSLDRDGFSYLIYEKSLRLGYNLGLFLLNRRRNLLKFESDDRSNAPFDEYVRFNLGVFQRHLLGAAQDILSGDENWIAEYIWSPVNMPDGLG